MTTINKIISIAIILAVSTVLISCGNTENKSDITTTSKSKAASLTGQAGVVDEESKANILKIANNSPDHTTLAAAVEAAEMQNILVNAGPLTVFAPINEAFEALPKGTVEMLLKPENKSKLAKILTSHASPAKLSKEQLAKGMNVYLATGHYVTSEEKDGEVYINGAKILGSVDASNGIVHVVDKVFLVAN